MGYLQRLLKARIIRMELKKLKEFSSVQRACTSLQRAHRKGRPISWETQSKNPESLRTKGERKKTNGITHWLVLASVYFNRYDGSWLSARRTSWLLTLNPAVPTVAATADAANEAEDDSKELLLSHWLDSSILSKGDGVGTCNCCCCCCWIVLRLWSEAKAGLL